MVVVSSAVTSTLIVFSPTESATWKSSCTVSASVSSVSEASRILNVALLSFTVGLIVISSTPFATSAV